MNKLLYLIGLIWIILYFIQIFSMIIFNITHRFYIFSSNAYIGNISHFIILIFIWYHIFIILRIKINIIIKIILIVIIIVIPFILLFPVLSIFNLPFLLYFNNEPFIDNINDIFPENIELEYNFEIYKNELDKLYNQYKNIECISNTNPGFKLTKDNDKCWRAIYIKILNEYKINNFQEDYPNLLKNLNKSYISNALISILDDNVDIPEHYGYFKGYYRYHLGYIIPEYKGNKPYIVCGNRKYYWKKGKGVLFDDMFNHYVRNDTPYKRVVLYLDIIRPELQNNLIINCLLYLISKNYFLQKIDKIQHEQGRISYSSK